MTSESLDAALRAEQRRMYLAARAGISAPAAGAIYWLALAVAGFYLSPHNWCVLAFFTSGLIFPLAILLSRPLRANLFVKSPLTSLTSLTMPTLLPVMLCFGFTIPAFYVERSLVPLGLCIGMTVHWPTIGWMYGKAASFSAHAIVRTLAAVALWFAFPQHRFSLIPLATGIVYTATFFWLIYDVKREATRDLADMPTP